MLRAQKVPAMKLPIWEIAIFALGQLACCGHSDRLPFFCWLPPNHGASCVRLSEEHIFRNSSPPAGARAPGVLKAQ